MNIEELKKQQAEAMKYGNFAKLNEINKKLYEIRELQRKAKQRKKEQQQDDLTAKKIEEILRGI